MSLQFGEQSLSVFLDSSSEVTLVCEPFFYKYIEPIVTSPSGDKANAHNLFKLSGMEQGQLPVSRYFELDVELLGFKVPKVGFLVIKDPNTVLSPDKPTSLPCVIGSNLIQLGLEEFVKQHSISAIQSLTKPAEVHPLVFAQFCVYYYEELEKLKMASDQLNANPTNVSTAGVSAGPSDPATNSKTPQNFSN